MTSTKTPDRPVPPPPSPPPAPAQPPAPPPGRPRLQLSATQLLASALAAVTATVAASYLGVSGTVIGAAVASIVTVTGNAVYSHSIRRTGQRVRSAVPIAGRLLPEDPARTQAMPPMPATPVPAGSRPPRRPAGWQRVLLASAAVFVVLIAAITTVELAIGRPLSDALRGKQAAGTSLSHTTGGTRVAPRPPTRTVTVTPSVVVTTPTVTQTAPPVTRTHTPTVTATPSRTPSPTATPSPSQSARASGSATKTGSASAGRAGSSSDAGGSAAPSGAAAATP